MKSGKFFFIFSIFVLLFYPNGVFALGGYLTGDYGQVAPVEIKAIIEYDKGVETITAVQTFVFNPLTVSNFYWVMVFPTEVKINKPDPKEHVARDIFLEYEKKTAKNFSKDNLLSKMLYPDLIEEKFEPSSIFSRMVSTQYVSVLPNFKTVGQLEEWFKNNSFGIPKNSRALFHEYIKRKWRFAMVAMDGGHIMLDAKESLTINGGHNIPLKVSFRTDKIIYPLKLVKIQPDYDSVTTPLSFEYGSSSEDILGVKDNRVDALLATQSSNIYPPLPLDLMNIKIDFFVLANEKVEAKGLTTIYADRQGDRYLTRLVGNRPLIQLEDVVFEKASNQSRVNPQISVVERIVRGMILLSLLVIISKFLLRKK